MAIEKLKID